jgi:hypothetical protein
MTNATSHEAVVTVHGHGAAAGDRSTDAMQAFQQLFRGDELATLDLGDRDEQLCFRFGRQVEEFLLLSENHRYLGALLERLPFDYDLPVDDRASDDFHFADILIQMYLDDHPPPHFHVIYGEFEGKIAIDTLELLRGAASGSRSGLGVGDDVSTRAA